MIPSSMPSPDNGEIRWHTSEEDTDVDLWLSFPHTHEYIPVHTQGHIRGIHHTKERGRREEEREITSFISHAHADPFLLSSPSGLISLPIVVTHHHYQKPVISPHPLLILRCCLFSSFHHSIPTGRFTPHRPCSPVPSLPSCPASGHSLFLRAVEIDCCDPLSAVTLSYSGSPLGKKKTQGSAVPPEREPLE